MSDNGDLKNLQKFVEDNVGIITAIGVFGALMSYLTINKNTQSFGAFLPFLSIVIFLFFVYSFIQIIRALPENKKGYYILSLQIFLGIFSFILVFYTLSVYSGIIIGLGQVSIILAAFYFAIWLQDKYKKELKKHRIIALFISTIVFFIFYKIDKCNLSWLDKEGVIYPSIAIFIFITFLLLTIFPLFDIVPEIWKKLMDNLGKFLIILGVIIALFAFLYWINNLVGLDIVTFASNIIDIIFVESWC